jgi:hypothetical protein
MVQPFEGKILLFIACIPCWVLIGSIAIVENIGRYDASVEQISQFIASLWLPLRLLYGGDVALYKHDVDHNYTAALAGKLLFGIGPAVPFVILAAETLKPTTPVTIIFANLLMLVADVWITRYFWTFGSGLKDKVI